MRRRYWGAPIVILTLIAAGPAEAGPLKKLARKLQSGLPDDGPRTVAVLGFSYTDARRGGASPIVQERLTTYLAEDGKLQLIERSLLETLLGEMKLERTGVIDAKTTNALGKILGVHALITGTLHDVDDDETEVHARLIEAQTGKILAAGMAVIERSWVDAPVTMLTPARPAVARRAPEPPPAARYEPAPSVVHASCAKPACAHGRRESRPWPTERRPARTPERLERGYLRFFEAE